VKNSAGSVGIPAGASIAPLLLLLIKERANPDNDLQPTDSIKYFHFSLDKNL